MAGMTGRLAERRRSRRIQIALPVILDNATGITRDVSPSGVFFWKSGVFSYGDSIRFSIEKRTATGRVMQRCRGAVVRTEFHGDDVGVAVRITESTTEAKTSQFSDIALPKASAEQHANTTQLGDDPLASSIKTVNHWLLLLRDKALKAHEGLQGQEVLEWEIPTIEDAATAHSRRLRACSVTIAGLVPNVSRALRHSGTAAENVRAFNVMPWIDETDARRSDNGVGETTEFVNWWDLHDGRGVRIVLEVCVANAIREKRRRNETPFPIILLRMASVRDGDDHRGLDENSYVQKSYTDPTKAFEVFQALAMESAVLMHLGPHHFKS